MLTFALGQDGPHAIPKGRFQMRTLVALYGDPGFLWPVLGYYGHMWESYSAWTWFGRYFYQVLLRAQPPGWSATQAEATAMQITSSFVAFGFISMGSLGALAGGTLADRWGKPQTIMVANAFSTLCCILIGHVSYHAYAAGIVGFIWGFWILTDTALFRYPPPPRAPLSP